MADSDLPQFEEYIDKLITIRYDEEEGCVQYDIGGLDDWSAESMVRQVADDLYQNLASPQNQREQIEDD